MGATALTDYCNRTEKNACKSEESIYGWSDAESGIILGMVNYRRAHIPGATYFFTVTLRDRCSRVLTEHVDALREVVQCVNWLWPFRVDALGGAARSLHTIWTLPEGETDFSKRWRAVKARFTRRLVRRGIVLAHDRRGEYDRWQRRFWEHLIRDEKDFARHVGYIHYHLVKHGWGSRPLDWCWSSIHRYVRLGPLPPDWASVPEEAGFDE